MDPTRAAAVATTFSLGESVGTPTFVARGAMGELWRVDVADGRRWAVKAQFDWAADDPRPRDLELQEAAADAGIPLPRPHLATDGRAVVDRVRVYEWVDLAPPLTAPFDAATLTEAGGILGTLHALAVAAAPGEEVDGWYRTAPSREAFAGLAEGGDRQGRGWAPQLRERLVQLGALTDLVAGSDQGNADDVMVCHRDLTPDNVFRPAGGGPLVVLDWENAGPMSAEAELAMTVSSWIGSADAQPLLAAYEAAGGPATICGASSFATSVATFLNYLEVLAVHSLEDDGHRAFAEPRLEAMLSEHLDHAVPRGWDS